MTTLAPPELDRSARDLVHLTVGELAACGLPVRNRLRTPDLRLITCPACQKETDAHRPAEQGVY